MPVVPIPEEIHAQVRAFKPLVEAVIGDALDEADFVGFLLKQAMTAMLGDLVGQDPATILLSLQKLADAYPAEVYSFVLESLRSGEGLIDPEGARQRIGFQPPA